MFRLPSNCNILVNEMNVFDHLTIEKRRKRISEKLDAILRPDDVVIVYCGDPIKKPGGLDQTYPFLPHPEYFWLTGIRRPYGITCYDKLSGWKDFLKPVTFEETLWEGAIPFAKAETIDDFKYWLASRNPKRLIFLGQEVSAKEPYAFQIEVKEAFNSVRRYKDQAEIDLIKKAAQAAQQGYQHIKNFIRPGVTEKDIQIEFEYHTLKAGADKMPYESIVGAGVSSAILHAVPTNKKVEKGDLILIDAGADIHDYCVDITRMFTADHIMTSPQQEIYDLVLRAQVASIKAAKAKTQWSEIHLISATIIAEGLKGLKIFKSEVDSIIESGAISTFFPHGVGHMVGLRVRDVGATLGQAPKPIAGINLRLDLALEENYVMTVEPGVYFVPAILESKVYHDKYKDHINWAETEKWKTFGGIRIEDDILIRKDEPEVLTAKIEK